MLALAAVVGVILAICDRLDASCQAGGQGHGRSAVAIVGRRSPTCDGLAGGVAAHAMATLA